jgi:hypothetical protein
MPCDCAGYPPWIAHRTNGRTFIGEQIPRGQNPSRSSPETPAASEPGPGATHAATAVGPASSSFREARRKYVVGVLISAFAVTVVSAVFIVSFIGGLHDPGPRSVPVGLVGSPAQASRLNTALGQHAPAAFSVTSYPTATAARDAITGRRIDAAAIPRPPALHLLVASAVSEAETNAILKAFTAAAAKAHLRLTVQNIRPLHRGDPEGLSMLFFIIALLAPSLAFGNQLITRFGTHLSELWHLAMITVYAAIISAVATAIADAGIGALTGAPWAIFGVGALLAFTGAVACAAFTRWAGAIGFLILLLLFIPVGISSSGSTLGPHMITQWYADLGRALPPGAAQPAVRNVTYFGGNAITIPLLVLSAWALAGVIALALAAVMHPPMPGRPGQRPDATAAGVPASAPSDHARVSR